MKRAYFRPCAPSTKSEPEGGDLGFNISMFRIAPSNEVRVNTRRFMRLGSFIQFTLVGAIAALFCSCEELPQQIQQPLAAILPTPPPMPGWWNDEGAKGEARIVVHLAEQKAYFYKGKHLVGESTVSTGKKGFSTPPGHYSIVSKDKNHFSSEFGDYIDSAGNIVVQNIDVRKDPKPRGTHFDPARMPYCMHFNGGYAMHQGYVPPFAASHGCIRVPQGMAERFYNNAPVGTPMTVTE
jgi:lipoprotein-anchoring transpeptidase ErfK/SrfK